jgi:hypothetical protein
MVSRQVGRGRLFPEDELATVGQNLIAISCTIDPVLLDSDGSLAFGKTSLAVAWLEQLQKSGKSVTTSIYAPVPAASGFLIASSRVLIAGAIIPGPVVGAYWPAYHL